MSEGSLSRVKSRQKQNSGEGQYSVKGNKRNSSPVYEEKQTGTPLQAAASLSRKNRHSAVSAKIATLQDGGEPESEGTPSRTQSYPSERVRLSKMFVNSLILIFIMLLGFLIWWGIVGAPPLHTLW